MDLQPVWLGVEENITTPTAAARFMFYWLLASQDEVSGSNMLSGLQQQQLERDCCYLKLKFF